MSSESTRSLQHNQADRIRIIADYQFGRGVGKTLFPDECSYILSRTGRVRQIMLAGERLATLRASDGRLTLGIAGARRLQLTLSPPCYRVEVRTDVADFIRQGKNVFSRHVLSADPAIRAEDEVLVVGEGDELLATGSAVLSGREMLVFNYGAAVKVRQGTIRT